VATCYTFFHSSIEELIDIPEKELRGLSPNFRIHVSVYSATEKYVNLSQARECGNWDWRRAIPFLGIPK
jgi:hypothetical protein